jgi:hypothetical protein
VRKSSGRLDPISSVESVHNVQANRAEGCVPALAGPARFASMTSFNSGSI